MEISLYFKSYLPGLVVVVVLVVVEVVVAGFSIANTVVLFVPPHMASLLPF